MATGQTILNLMEVLNQELQLQSGENDVTRGLIAVNAAQDHFESLVSQYPGLMGDTTGTVTTTASTETTSFPSGVLRVDGLQFIDPVTSRPSYDLEPIDSTGGHINSYKWPYYITATYGTGKPTRYWTNGRNIYWSPLPDATHTVRWYGLSAASDVTAAGTFAYPDVCMLPFAVFATKLLKMGIDDSVVDLSNLAQETFYPVIQTLSNFVRDRAPGFRYKFSHET